MLANIIPSSPFLVDLLPCIYHKLSIQGFLVRKNWPFTWCFRNVQCGQLKGGGQFPQALQGQIGEKHPGGDLDEKLVSQKHT